MRKTISILLAMMMGVSALTFTGCGTESNDNGSVTTPTTVPTAEPTTPSVQIESASAFYTDVWAAFTEDTKFPCGGGDAEHINEEGPGEYQLTEENAESFKHLLHLTDELYDMLENDAATLQHMMNLNTFSSAVVKLKDSADAAEFAEGYKTAIQGQRWMCGFPDKVVVISVGDYVVMAFGLEDNINNLVAACSAVDAQATVLVDDAAMIE